MTSQIAGVENQLSGTPDIRRVWLLAFGHFTNDLYGNLATALAPYFVIAGKLSAPVAGALVLAYLAGSSVLQPLFGIISDRTGRRWFAVAGPVWIGCCMSLLVIAPAAWVIFLLVGAGGIGTAAFHPQGASMVNRLAGNSRGRVMAIFSMGGNLGFGLGPILAAAMVAVGNGWTGTVAIPGIVCSALLLRFAPPAKSHGMETARKSLRDAQTKIRALSLLVLIIAVRSGAMSAVIFLAPLYFNAQHLPPSWGSYGSSLFLLVGAFGGLYAGSLSDRIGRKPVVVFSLVLASPFVLLIAVLPGLYSWAALAPAGIAVLASNPVTVVQAQELLPKNAGLAAGLTLGLGFGLSGVITFIVSDLTKVVGPRETLMWTACLPLLAAALALVMPSRWARPSAGTHPNKLGQT